MLNFALQTVDGNRTGTERIIPAGRGALLLLIALKHLHHDDHTQKANNHRHHEFHQTKAA